MEFLSLLLQYKKPKEILTLEKELLGELKKLKGTSEGDIDCKTQWTALEPLHYCICFPVILHVHEL